MAHALPIRHADAAGGFGLTLIEGLDARAEDLAHVGPGVQGNREETGDEGAVAASEFPRERPADDEAVHRMDEDGEHRKVHEEDLHEKRRTTEETHPDRDGPPHAVVQQRLPRIVPGACHAGHPEEHAEAHAADDAGKSEFDGHTGPFYKEGPVFSQYV